MIITSNDDIQLKELYKDLDRDGEEVTLEKIIVEGAYGVKIKIDLKLDLTRILELLISKYYDHKREKLYIKKTSGELKAIDVEIMRGNKEIGSLKVEEGSELYIENIKLKKEK